MLKPVHWRQREYHLIISRLTLLQRKYNDRIQLQLSPLRKDSNYSNNAFYWDSIGGVTSQSWMYMLSLTVVTAGTERSERGKNGHFTCENRACYSFTQELRCKTRLISEITASSTSREKLLTVDLSWGLASSSSSASTIFAWPYLAAMCNGLSLFYTKRITSISHVRQVNILAHRARTP